jgi:UDPglucose 6-dehydrogenase
MRVGIFGAGYVGIVTAAGLAELGHTVVLYDSNASKIAALRAGALPIYEPELADLVGRAVAANALSFAHDPDTAARGRDVVMIAVGTPTGADGRSDISSVREAAASIAAICDPGTLIVNKSTASVGTVEALKALTGGVDVAANPEFLREGSAVHDFFHPDRIVIGCTEATAELTLRALYAGIDAPAIVTTPRTAELIKYASNAFLAMKVSFANEIAAICAAAGVDVVDVLAGTGADRRIGTAHLQPGLGFGGSCFPKDLLELRRLATDGAIETGLLDAIIEANDRQVAHVAERIERALGGLKGTRIGVLGVAFKPDTDDVRHAPSLTLISALIAHGATVTVHDPAAMHNARALLGDRVTYAPTGDCYAVAEHADALVIATEWDAYRDLDLTRLRGLMARRVFVDARNLYEPHRVLEAGFQYEGIGRSAE